MKLVPTLERMVAGYVAEDFWKNHLANQEKLDAQCEGRTDANIDFRRFADGPWLRFVKSNRANVGAMK